jgi:multiple sugar transport system ATP-binding protein
VAGFIGSPKMNFLDATDVEADGGAAVVRLQTGAQIRCVVDASRATVGDKVTLGVRPEHFEAAAPGATDNVIDASVTFVESLGSTTHAYCDYPGAAETLVCELDGATRLRNGATLSLAVPAARTYLFDAAGQAFRRHVAETQQEAA